MKLLLCNYCGDIFKLIVNHDRQCLCGRTKGKYIDTLNAEYTGEYAIPLGIDNFSLRCARYKQPKEGMGERFEAFVIPKKCDTFKKLKTETNGEIKL